MLFRWADVECQSTASTSTASMTTAAPASRVAPGRRLASTAAFSGGRGTYTRGTTIHAAVIGTRCDRPHPTLPNHIVIDVTPDTNASAVPHVDGPPVIGRVLRVNPRYAAVAIQAVGEHACRDEYMGLIRQPDIRATERDKARVLESFRPGDVVTADVVSLGDARSYYLSTARNELGVVSARSRVGAAMVPVSWCEMRCVETGEVEPRKCAKPVLLAA